MKFAWNECCFYWIFLLISFGALLGAAYFLFLRKPRIGKRPLMVGRLIPFTGMLMLSVFALRYAVGMYNNWHPEKCAIVLNWAEEIGNSIVHSLQTFSMDEDYTEYLGKGKEMFGVLTGGNKILVNIFGGYSAFQSMVAPIAGGALLLDILANLLPSFRLWLCNLLIWRKKYYFNELSSRSLLLAESLQATANRFAKPVMIFCKVGQDVSEDLRNAAKQLDAICLEADLERVRKCRFGYRNFMLISESDNENLHDLAGLSQRSCGGYLKLANIYLFTYRDAYIQLEQKAYANLTRWGMEKNDAPILYPVRTVHNAIANLLVDVPLYEPLIHKAQQRKLQRPENREDLHLKLTIVGCGTYGMEMLLTAYSVGQILNCTLEICVVSRETEEEFMSRLNTISPELMATTRPGDPCLRYNEKGDYNAPYCSIDYISCDVESQAFHDLLQSNRRGKTILDSDYILVSLGDDSDNINTTELLTRKIATWHLQRPDARTVLACVVTDSDLAELLDKGDSAYKGIYLHAIGSKREVYSAQNVLMLNYSDASDAKHKSYMDIRSEQMAQQTKRQKDAYSTYSSTANAMHKKYRIFALGLLLDGYLLSESVFSAGGHKSARYLKQQKAAEERYLKFLCNGGKEITDAEALERHKRALHLLAWMEHRRWNAYIRASGFRHTSQYMRYANGKGTHKNLRLKLHPCLVEASQEGILAHIDYLGMIEPKTLVKRRNKDAKWLAAFGAQEADLLDMLSFDLFDKGINDYDFKYYDYPNDHVKNKKIRPEALDPEIAAAGAIRAKYVGDKGSETNDEKPEDRNVQKSRLQQWIADFLNLRFTGSGRNGHLEYCPRPVNCQKIELPKDWDADEMAKAVHNSWMKQRKQDGWQYGPKRDDGALTHPSMVAFADLPRKEKNYDRRTAETAIKALIDLGYVCQPRQEGDSLLAQKDLMPIMEQIASNVHEQWAYSRKKEGWRWGEVRNDTQKLTPCMVPYVSLPESEKEYDRITAMAVIDILQQTYTIAKKDDKKAENQKKADKNEEGKKK